MSATQPFHFVIHADGRRDQPRTRQKRSQKPATIMLLRGLVLLFLLAIPAASTPFVRQQFPTPPPPFKPIGGVSIVTAPGFDTCIAPPEDLLETWWDTSPYRWFNIYLGGVSMYPTCGGKNLTPEWVSTVYEQGWSMLPTWVGLQAPCAKQHAVMSNHPTVSYIQGQSEAEAAIRAANRLSLSSTAPIYFDMEHFNPTTRNGARDNTCIQAVNAFLSGWNSTLVAHGHLAGFYASASNYPMLSESLMETSAVAWIAGGGSWAQTYDHKCTVYGNHYISDDSWSPHQRIYQYTGGHKETYNHKTWNIDSDCADAPLVGHITARSLVIPFQDP